MYRVHLEDTSEELAHLVGRVLAGEDVIVMQEDEPVARLVSIQQSREKAAFGSAKGIVTIADDFDAPLVD
jgi:antitoxin (DNA-binding transcriptional repressor) of toxin-antitoxin stability system